MIIQEKITELLKKANWFSDSLFLFGNRQCDYSYYFHDEEPTNYCAFFDCVYGEAMTINYPSYRLPNGEIDPDYHDKLDNMEPNGEPIDQKVEDFYKLTFILDCMTSEEPLICDDHSETEPIIFYTDELIDKILNPSDIFNAVKEVVERKNIHKYELKSICELYTIYRYNKDGIVPRNFIKNNKSLVSESEKIMKKLFGTKRMRRIMEDIVKASYGPVIF